MHGRESNVLAQGMEARLRVEFHLTYTTAYAVCLTIPEHTTFYVTAWDWMGHHGVTWNIKLCCGAITHCLQGPTYCKNSMLIYVLMYTEEESLFV